MVDQIIYIYRGPSRPPTSAENKRECCLWAVIGTVISVLLLIIGGAVYAGAPTPTDTYAERRNREEQQLAGAGLMLGGGGLLGAICICYLCCAMAGPYSHASGNQGLYATLGGMFMLLGLGLVLGGVGAMSNDNMALADPLWTAGACCLAVGVWGFICAAVARLRRNPDHVRRAEEEQRRMDAAIIR
jgi:ribose/xylose/arabinose/galactoside ABC-type transport system permease subunit